MYSLSLSLLFRSFLSLSSFSLFFFCLSFLLFFFFSFSFLFLFLSFFLFSFFFFFCHLGVRDDCGLFGIVVMTTAVIVADGDINVIFNVSVGVVVVGTDCPKRCESSLCPSVAIVLAVVDDGVVIVTAVPSTSLLLNQTSKTIHQVEDI